MSGKRGLFAQMAALEREIARKPRYDRLAPVYYVYMLIDPRNDTPFYVGKGKKKRHQQHVAEWRRGDVSRGNAKKLARIGEIHKAGLQVQYAFVAEGLTEPAAFRLEWATIRKHMPTLTNCLRDQRAEAERSLERLDYMISRIKPPTQWVRDWVRENRRPPTESALNGYTDVFLSHLKLRENIRKAVQEYNAHARQSQA